MSRRFLVGSVGVLLLGALMWPGGSATGVPARSTDLLITETNGATNEVLVFARHSDGSVSARQRVTVGVGTGAYLHTSNAVVRLAEHQVVAVNAGGASIAVLRERAGSLTLQSTIATGADFPVSLAVHDRTVYVLHSGAPFVNPVGPTSLYGPPVISAVKVDAAGNGHVVAASRLALPGGCASYPCTATSIYGGIGVTPDGRTLLVTDTATNAVVTIPVAARGVLGPLRSTPSSIEEPYGFAISHTGLTVVSGASGLTGDSLAASGVVRAGGWQPRQTSLGLPGGGACWVSLSPNQRLAYVSNTTPSANFASGGLSTVLIDRTGNLTVIGNAPVPFSPTAFPLDSAVSSDGRNVYVMSAEGLFSFGVGADGVAAYVPALDVRPGLAQVGFGATGLLDLPTR